MKRIVMVFALLSACATGADVDSSTQALSAAGSGASIQADNPGCTDLDLYSVGWFKGQQPMAQSCSNPTASNAKWTCTGAGNRSWTIYKTSDSEYADQNWCTFYRRVESQQSATWFFKCDRRGNGFPYTNTCTRM